MNSVTRSVPIPCPHCGGLVRHRMYWVEEKVPVVVDPYTHRPSSGYAHQRREVMENVEAADGAAGAAPEAARAA